MCLMRHKGNDRDLKDGFQQLSSFAPYRCKFLLSFVYNHVARSRDPDPACWVRGRAPSLHHVCGLAEFIKLKEVILKKSACKHSGVKSLFFKQVHFQNLNTSVNGSESGSLHPP